MDATRTVQRQNGIALWRQIADRIRASISDGAYDRTGMVPPEMVLAEQFGVNRHTVRAALSALAQEGIVRAVQGRGTMIERRDKLSFPISRRTRFTEGIGSQARDFEGIVLEQKVEAPGADVARALGLTPGAPVLRLESLRKADRRPVSVGTSWFPLPRFEGMADAFARTGSITRAFAACGLDDYVRARTAISALHADPADAGLLQLSPGAIVLVTTAVNQDLDGRPVQYALTRFSADLVQLTIGE